jgi:hypothetical protein
VPGETDADVAGAGHHQRPGLVDRLGLLGAGGALEDHQRADCLHRAVPAPGGAGRPAGLGGPRGADGIERIGLALPAPVLAVSPVHLHDPYPGGRQVPGQARTVAAGPFDPGRAHRPESTQPGQQAGIPGRGRRELEDTEQPTNTI